MHPCRAWDRPPKAWFCCTTYELLAQAGWDHLKSFLFLPDESVHDLPSRHVESIQWIRPSIPKNVIMRNGSEITFKSYEQGPGEFQAAQLDQIVVDEECPGAIWNEMQARFLATKAPRIVVAATPIQGVEWLTELRRMAEEGRGGVSHFRLRTEDNPGHNREEVANLRERLRDRPEELRLRLEGYPFYAQGLVYPDGLFSPQHVVQPHPVDPRDYTVYCCIDPGFRNCAALWVAVRADGSEWLVFRDYMGRELTIAQNAQRILAISAPMRIEGYLMDPHAAERRLDESGERIIDLYLRHGIDASPAPRHEVEAGIQVVSDLLSERGANGECRFHVFDTCQEFLRERRSYRRRAAKEDGDVGKENPEKRDDHLMDAWRYLANTDLPFRVSRSPIPPAGSLGRVFYDQRHPPPKGGL